MKLPCFITPGLPPARGRRAFTITEAMVSMAIFGMLVVVIISSHIFGLRLMGLATGKLTSLEGSRTTVGRMGDEIRSARLTIVGNGDASSFTGTSMGAPQTGNALQIHPTTNTNTFIRYFRDPAAQTLKRTTEAGGVDLVMARAVTNTFVFTGENFRGQVMTNNQGVSVIHLMLNFLQTERAPGGSGVGVFDDSFQIDTRVTRRSIE